MGWTTALVMLAAAAAPPAQMPAPWREAPEFVALFAPADARAGAYRAYVAAVDLDTALLTFAADPTLSRTPGTWAPQPMLPLDVFGQAGRYDRWRLARLYGGRRPRVARGARLVDGRLIETWTLIAPYPEAGLQRLETGTLLLILRRP
jgi:hypothetical protein